MMLEGQQIFQLVSLLAVLALFVVSLRGHMAYRSWFRRWEAERKARRDAEIGRDSPPPADTPRKGPWG